MKRPLIGVSVSRRSGWRIFPLIALNVWMAGGRAVRWDTRHCADISAVQGIILGGGDDVGPRLYGGSLGISARLDPDRDAMELAIAETAWSENVPMLGICRGAQMINIALGGTLNQQAWQTYGQERFIKTILPKREVCIVPHTRLAKIAGSQPMWVNALHTQAVDALGQGLRVAARDTGGMVQAVERVRDPFVVGVQWHPEHLFYAYRQRRLFKALVSAAQAYAQAHPQIPAAEAAMA